MSQPETEARVLAQVRAAGVKGATCPEIERATGLSHQTASARLTDLTAQGEIVDSGMRRRGTTGRSVRFSTVWVLPEHGPVVPGAIPRRDTVTSLRAHLESIVRASTPILDLRSKLAQGGPVSDAQIQVLITHGGHRSHVVTLPPSALEALCRAIQES